MAGAVDERRLVGEQGAQLAGRERGEDRAAAGGQVSREAHTDIGDEVRPTRGTLVHDVEHVPAVQHGEVRALTHPVDQLCEQRAPEHAERLLPGVPTGELEGGDPEPVATGFGQVDHEAVLLQHAEEVVDRRSRKVEC